MTTSSTMLTVLCPECGAELPRENVWADDGIGTPEKRVAFHGSRWFVIESPAGVSAEDCFSLQKTPKIIGKLHCEQTDETLRIEWSANPATLQKVGSWCCLIFISSLFLLLPVVTILCVADAETWKKCGMASILYFPMLAICGFALCGMFDDYRMNFASWSILLDVSALSVVRRCGKWSETVQYDRQRILRFRKMDVRQESITFASLFAKFPMRLDARKFRLEAVFSDGTTAVLPQIPLPPKQPFSTEADDRLVNVMNRCLADGT